VKHAIALTIALLSSPLAFAQVEAPSAPRSQRSPADATQESQSQPDDNHAALAARKRGRIEMMIMPSGKRSECDPSGCTRFELKAPASAK
jgi:hypothetical protein